MTPEMAGKWEAIKYKDFCSQIYKDGLYEIKTEESTAETSPGVFYLSKTPVKTRFEADVRQSI